MPKDSRTLVKKLTVEAVDRPAPSLLASWGKRMAGGVAVGFPVLLGRSRTLEISRGNKRALRVNVGIKKQTPYR